MKKTKSKKKNDVKKKQQSEDNKTKLIVNILKDNYTWVIGVSTFLGLIIKGILKFIEHITSEIFFSYYGLNHGLYNYHDASFIYDLIISIIFVLAFFSALICFEQLKDKIKNKKIFCSENFGNLFLIIILNTYIIKTTQGEIKIIEMPILIIIYMLFEFIASHLIFNNIKKIDEKKQNNQMIKDMFINYIKLMPYIILLFIITNSCRIYLRLQEKKEYNIIDKNKIVIYTSNDYYLTLDCDINGDEIIIYRGRQEKNDNNNIKTQLTKFNKVQIQDIN